MRNTICLGGRLLMVALGLSTFTGCVVQNTRSGLVTQLDEAALFSTTLQSYVWQGGTATLRRTQGGYDQVKMTTWGPVVTLGRGLAEPHIERIDVISGHQVVMVSTRGDASCPRKMQLVFRQNDQASIAALPEACQIQHVRIHNGAMWGSNDGRRDQWMSNGVNLWRVRPPAAAVAMREPQGRQLSTRNAAARRTQLGHSSLSSSLTAPLARPSSERLSHLDKISEGRAVELERSPEMDHPVRVDITGG